MKLRRGYRKITEKQWFQFRGWNPGRIVGGRKFLTAVRSIKPQKNTAEIQAFCVRGIPVAAEQVVFLIAQGGHAAQRHSSLFIGSREQADHAAAVDDLTYLRRLRYAKLIAEPALFRVIPGFDPGFGDGKGAGAVVAIPQKLCFGNKKGAAVKGEEKAADTAVI